MKNNEFILLNTSSVDFLVIFITLNHHNFENINKIENINNVVAWMLGSPQIPRLSSEAKWLCWMTAFESEVMRWDIHEAHHCSLERGPQTSPGLRSHVGARRTSGPGRPLPPSWPCTLISDFQVQKEKK